jgi:hypothetical protein
MPQQTTIEIMGGLGNQLFQIFTLLAYGLRNQTPVFFTKTPIQHGARKTTYWETTLLNALQPMVKAIPYQQQHPIQIYHEREFHYNALPFDQKIQTHYARLFGYFQSYKYFQDQAAALFQLINLTETQAQVKSKTPHYTYEKTIAVHFRVGDYMNLQNFHPLMTLAYYTEALTQFLQAQNTFRATALFEAIGASAAAASTAAASTAAASTAAASTAAASTAASKWQILYFCEQNDQTYVETQFIKPLQANPMFKDKFIFQCIDHRLADWEQVIVMSLCQHKIIANSTFSWWGAYFGDKLYPRSASLVYYPTPWFGPMAGTKNTCDLFPPHWQKINI